VRGAVGATRLAVHTCVRGLGLLVGGGLLKTAVAELMRVAWRSVSTILERVAAEAMRKVDLLDGLRRIGVDEISHRKGQRYLTVVVDHHSARLVWAAPGRDRRTVLAFFDALGEERCKQIELVSADMAAWILRADRRTRARRGPVRGPVPRRDARERGTR
jgi:hypothetical protein